MMEHTPETRMVNLLRYFGWKGGTIHQVAEETGVSVQDLLFSPPAPHYNGTEVSPYVQGQMANETCSLPYRLNLAKRTKYNTDYWIGVACAITDTYMTYVRIQEGNAEANKKLV